MNWIQFDDCKIHKLIALLSFVCWVLTLFITIILQTHFRKLFIKNIILLLYRANKHLVYYIATKMKSYFCMCLCNILYVLCITLTLVQSKWVENKGPVFSWTLITTMTTSCETHDFITLLVEFGQQLRNITCYGLLPVLWDTSLVCTDLLPSIKT